MSKPEVIVDKEQGILYVDHLGYTFRTLLAAAAQADPVRRNWRVFYKAVVIGNVRIKTI
jgi:hypothetical protein